MKLQAGGIDADLNCGSTLTWSSSHSWAAETMSGISKETINRLHPETATLAFRDTLPQADKPVQLLTTGKTVRSVHGVSYTRLWNSELIETIRDVATVPAVEQAA